MKRKEEFDKILFSGEWYDTQDLKLVLYQERCINEMNKFNKTKASPLGLLVRMHKMKKMFGAIGDGSYVEPPIHANFGGKNVFIGKEFYANFNLTLVDDGKITIGDNVMIGPNVTIATPLHPLEAEKRLEKKNQRNLPVTIGNNVWIASNAVILPNVTIGDNAVIAAGAVVTKDVPPNVMVAGVPAKIVKELNKEE